MQITLSKINFGTSCRSYKHSNGHEYGCYTTFFRSDLCWEELPEYEIEHFKNKRKVNILMFAASDGSEAYSKIISMKEKFGKSCQKFFPIKAFDIDDEIVKVAQSGLISADDSDIADIATRCKDYTSYFQKVDEKLDIKDDPFVKRSNVLKARERLTENVVFSQGDMFERIKKLKDNSNTILMCRNILGYFLDDKIEDFIKLAETYLKKDSLFIIGDFDNAFAKTNSILEKHNFVKIFKNVFKKI